MLVEPFTYSPSQVPNFTHGIELKKVIYQPVLGLKEAFFGGEVPYKSSFLSMSMCRYNSPRFILCSYKDSFHGIDFVDDRKSNNKTWRNPRFYWEWVPAIQGFLINCHKKWNFPDWRKIIFCSTLGCISTMSPKKTTLPQVAQGFKTPKSPKGIANHLATENASHWRVCCSVPLPHCCLHLWKAPEEHSSGNMATLLKVKLLVGYM